MPVDAGDYGRDILDACGIGDLVGGFQQEAVAVRRMPQADIDLRAGSVIYRS
jgi:hypothetical protein